METIMNENNQQQKEVEMEEVQQLLKDVYEATKEIKQEKAEAFDVVGICIGRQETIHSKFLAELLNPHGSHGLGSVFLKAFYEQIGLKDFHSEGCSVRTEVICEEKGKKKEQEKDNEGQESNGRTDIVIKNSKELVVIENKIYAKDQQDQLQKYDAWMKNKHPEDNGKVLLYLTLDGHEASNPGDTSYKRISYKDDILRWLEKCIYIAEKNNTFTKATLVQYQELIKKLTGEHMNPSMKDAVTSATTTNAQNYLAAAYIAQTFNDYHQRIIQEIAEKCNGDMICKMERPNTDGRIGFSYTLKEDQQYKLLFEFQKGNYKELCYGLHLNDTTEPPKDFLNIKISFKCIAGMGLTFQEGNKDVCDSPNEEGWFFAIKADPDFRDWDAKSFADRWKNRKLSFQEIKKEYKKEIKNYIGILNKIINDKENQGKF
ncbi:MAG: PD-(D/E)XK nuclease family protein [Victivallales bacterium]|nr:PD-(D/E)XK nuclease family protein [Victivallales bacterium]